MLSFAEDRIETARRMKIPHTTYRKDRARKYVQWGGRMRDVRFCAPEVMLPFDAVIYIESNNTIIYLVVPTML